MTKSQITAVLGVITVLGADPAQLTAQPSDLIAAGARVEERATGFAFVEGPVWDPDGALLFSDIPNERIHRWTAADGVTTFREPSGRANGLRFDLDGNLIACEMGGRQITSTTRAGDVRVLADRFEGHRFNSPNDLWIDPRGGIYFTDPRYGSTDDQEIDGYHVYYLTPDRTEVRQVTDDLERPNGIVGTVDGERLYVADHGAGRTYVYAPAADGHLTDKQLFVAQGSDGMTIDERGNVYLTGEDITIHSPDGATVGSIAVPEAPANLTFGGPDGTTLFITARTSLYSLEMTVTGQ